MVRRIASLLNQVSIAANPIHSQQQQRQRLKSLDRFKGDPNGVMVATDVAARGLDIPDVRCIVHHQIPRTADTYIHRSGRAARAGKDGITILLVIPKETLRFHSLFKALERPQPPEFPVDLHLLTECRERMKLAEQLHEIASKGPRSNINESWVTQAAEALGVELDSESDDDSERDFVARDVAESERQKLQARMEDLQHQLAERLAIPLQRRINRKFFSGGLSSITAGKLEQTSDDPDLTKSAVPAAAMVESVNLAQRFQEGKCRAAKAAKEKLSRRQARERKMAARKQHQNGRLPELIEKGLLRYHHRRGEKRSRLLVIPQLQSREASGPDALQVLRKKLGK